MQVLVGLHAGKCNCNMLMFIEKPTGGTGQGTVHWEAGKKAGKGKMLTGAEASSAGSFTRQQGRRLLGK